MCTYYLETPARTRQVLISNDILRTSGNKWPIYGWQMEVRSQSIVEMCAQVEDE